MNPLPPNDESLFAAAFELPAGKRGAFLEKACGGDTALRKRIEELLRANDTAEQLLNTPSNAANPVQLDYSAGDRIGRYRLYQELGEGGCGTVYLAEQDEPVSRRVALKVVKLGMDTKDVIARFEAERQLLAMMEHPNIAKVFDAGTTENGRPFFVMELVRGVPITKFCNDQKLGTEARLRLFIQVCHAVQHAHQKGIIHRDIKPSNILVALHDDLPVPKIIDFGIAKATAGRVTTDAAVTGFGQFMGTPAYMSPEQALFSVLDVDTRSDIYSLGVLLYELLTGQLPFNAKELMEAGLDEMRRHIREVEPVRPSTRLRTLGNEALRTMAQLRAISPPKLIKLVSGDLDWIVMRCIEKDRARRYGTANGLADDVTRHLANQPIWARPPSSTYRFRKFVSRHRFVFSAATAVAVTLVFGIVVSTRQAVRANRAEGTSRAVNDFLIYDLLQQADSRAQADTKATPNPDLTVRELLDRSGEKVGSRYEKQPETEAEVRHAIGVAYDGIGLSTKAAFHLERAHELRILALGPEHAKTLETASLLASSYYAQGKFEAAATLHSQTLEIQRRKLGAEHPSTLASMNNLGITYQSQGKLADAVRLLAETLEKRARVLGAEHPNTLKVMNNLANTYRQQGRHEESTSLHAKTVEIRTRVMGLEHPDTLTSMNNLGMAYYSLGRWADAATQHEQTFAARKRALGASHPETLVSANNLALTYAAQGRQSEAAALYRQTAEIFQQVRGADHPHTLSVMNNLADALNAQGKSAEAVEILTRTLETRKRVRGPEHPETLWSVNSLANAIRSQGRVAEAIILHSETLAIRQRKLGADHPDTITSMSNLALTYLEAGRVSDAIPLLQQVLTLRKAKLGPAHTETKRSVADLRAAYTLAGRKADADALEDVSSVGTNHPR